MKSFNIIKAIALNTFRETVRDRILYAIVVFALLATLAGLVFGSLSAEQDLRILEDLGLVTITIFGGVIAVFVGTTLVFKEIDKKTIYLIVTKPIDRWQFITGKFLGLSLSVAVTNFAMGIFFMGVVALQMGNLSACYPMFCSLSLIYLELVMVIALATFFSTFCTPLMSMIFTCGLWLVGHMSFSFDLLKKLAEDSDRPSPAAAALATGLQYLMPDLARLTELRSNYMDGVVEFGFSSQMILLYILSYVVVLLALSTAIAERREFN